MKVEDIHEIMRSVLDEFPVSEVAFYLPKWVEMLSIEHPIKQELLHTVQNLMPVSYTHLDVYKRQRIMCVKSKDTADSH